MTLVMGVLNVTPDSFSDGGRWLDRDAAIRHGLEMIAEGADVIDVGGESTRPGAEPVAEEEERRRIVPVIEALAGHGARVSVDTRKGPVAEAAVAAGATLINDVSAMLWPVAAAAGPGVGWVAMHMQGQPQTMQVDPYYTDVVGEVLEFLVRRSAEAETAGVGEVWIDPGIGFGKNQDHNLRLLKHLDRFVATGRPVVIGTSRKSFLGRLAAATGPDGPAAPLAPADDRLAGSLATAVWAINLGVGMVRVHDVAPTVHALRLAGKAAARVGS